MGASPCSVVYRGSADMVIIDGLLLRQPQMRPNVTRLTRVTRSAVGPPVIVSDLPAHQEMAGDLAVYRDPTDKSGWLKDICMFADVNGGAAEIPQARLPISAADPARVFHPDRALSKDVRTTVIRATPAVLPLIRDAKPSRVRSRPRDWGCLYLCDVIRT